MLDGANPVGRYREEDASPTDGVVAGTAGKVAGTTTGVVAGVLAGVVAGVLAGVVAGVLAGVVAVLVLDARPVGRDRVETARRTDMEGDTGRELTCERRGAADRGEYRQAAGAFGQVLRAGHLDEIKRRPTV